MWRVLGKLLLLGASRHWAKRPTAAVETAAVVLVLSQKHLGRGPKRDMLVRAAHVIFIPAAVIKGVRLVKRVLGKRPADLPPPPPSPLLNSGPTDPLSAATIPTFKVQPPPLPKHVPRAQWGYLDIPTVAPEYAAWVRCLQNVLAQHGLRSLPPGVDPDGLELTRAVLYGGLLAANKQQDAVKAVAATAQRLVSTVNWRASYPFMSEEELKEWEDVFWWVGPDQDGSLWLHIHLARAVSRSAHGEGRRAGQALLSQLDRGTRLLMLQGQGGAAGAGGEEAGAGEGAAGGGGAGGAAGAAGGAAGEGVRLGSMASLGGAMRSGGMAAAAGGVGPLASHAIHPSASAGALSGAEGGSAPLRVDDRVRVVVVGSGSNVRQALRMVGLMREFSRLVQRHYPGRLRTMHLVDMPRGLRLGMAALMNLMPWETRQKIKVNRVMDLPDGIAAALIAREEAAATRGSAGGARTSRRASLMGALAGTALGRSAGGGFEARKALLPLPPLLHASAVAQVGVQLRLLLIGLLPALLMAATALLTYKSYKHALLR